MTVLSEESKDAVVRIRLQLLVEDELARAESGKDRRQGCKIGLLSAKVAGREIEPCQAEWHGVVARLGVPNVRANT